MVKDKLIATPLDRGAGVTMSLVRADGVLVVPQLREGFDGGSEVEVQLLKPFEEIKNTIVSIGSHDLVMDLLGNKIRQHSDNLFLSSAHVGSLGGIMAMKKQECHIAPIHLLDSETGKYNEAFVRRYINDIPVAIIKFIRRNQGLMVQKGNPHNIRGVEDLAAKGLQYINRQRGAGTRVLLDYCLQKLEINPEGILGYEREMTTHLSVAAAISSGTADCGMGISSAAKAMGLDFVPVGWEDYDLLISQEMLADDKIQKLLTVIRSQSFIDAVEALGGYDTKGIGEIILL
jgi:putative molybdopterin biosynthesis protein